MSHSLATSVQKKALLALAALICAVSMLFIQAPQAHAAALTTVQVNAIINLLVAFDAPQATVDNVRTILTTGASAPVTTQPTYPTYPTYPTNTDTTANTNTATQPTTGAALVGGCPVLETTLQKGSTGAQVSALQTYLTSMGLLAAGNVTGTFGPLTEAAVATFQLQNNIETGDGGAGVAGPKTRAAIQKKCTAARDAAEVTSSTPAGGSENADAGGTAGYTDPGTSSQPDTSYKGSQPLSQSACLAQINGATISNTDYYHNPDKPSTLEFMTKAGITDASIANAIGVLGMGQLKDFRDWKAIMASSDPVNAARQATGALLNSGRTDYVPSIACKVVWLPKTTILATTQNFTFYKDEYPQGVIYRVGVHDSNGFLITIPGNSFVLFKNILNFGLDSSQLIDLQAQLDAKGIDQTKLFGSWPRNFKDSSISLGSAYNLVAAIGMTVLSPYEFMVDQLTTFLYEEGLY